MKTKLAESSKKAQELVDRLVNCFEENMDNDLDVKGAFDDLFEILSELDNLRIRGKLSSKDAHTAVTNIQKIDSVLQIIF
jgi:cysteinyl-tRNA synthetase